jgi:MFS family permease
MTLAVGLLPVVRSAGLLLGLIAVFLFTSSAGFVTALALAGDRAPLTGRALFMSRYTSATDLGSALGPMIGYGLYASVGLGWAAGFSVALLVPLLLVLAVGGRRT